MIPALAYAAAFLSAFFTVFLLGLNSKILRDDKVFAAFVVSWGITLSQTAATYIIAHVNLPIHLYILWAGWGGSLGIVSAHYLYKHLTRKEKSCAEH